LSPPLPSSLRPAVPPLACVRHFARALRTGTASLFLGVLAITGFFGTTGCDGNSKGANLPAITSVAAGVNHSLYITTEGKLYAMGGNEYGQLGDGTSGDNANKAKPVLIADNVASVAAGVDHSLYITTDGKLYAMGWNEYGQLGNGTSIFNDSKSKPVLIAE
jgi:alpha-tubulin suppressor-like RCC1 family protein